MNEPMAVTTGRMVLAPVFFILYQLATTGSRWLIAACWVVFGLIEFSDLFDGLLARRLGKVSELGKVLDPFADSVSRITYFVCFAGSGIMPLWALLILIYRDAAIAYIRVLFARRSVMLPGRLSGKVKAWAYALAGIFGLALFSSQTLDILSSIRQILVASTRALIFAAVAVAIWTLADYGRALVRNWRSSST